MNLNELYTHEELLDGMTENYTKDSAKCRPILDRILNKGITAFELETLLSSAYQRGQAEA